MRRLPIALLTAAAVGLLGSCASEAPIWIRVPPQDNPSLTQVRQGLDRYLGRTVRWGGTIAGVRNLESETEIEVVERTLSGSGRPDEDSGSEGRFLVRIPSFLDPAVYSQGRLLSVRGRVEGEERRKIDEYLYHYPVLVARHHHLWEPLPPRPYRDPWLREPWARDPYLNGPDPYW